ncbi:MAG: adenylate/guanylate cyclase domain-containing protein [Thermodesulfovibrionales bacterium]|nr:adenylate/guanylate cyclase domain-containing protein [Thermodesulfovibrionales bacterium]
MNIHQKIGRRIFVFCILSSACFLALLIWRPGAVEERVETLTLDYRFQTRNFISPPKVSGNVAVVVIDEKSLRQYGRWPWSRTLQAELIAKILALQPRVLAVDIFYTEPEDAQSDKALGEVLHRAKDKIILAAVFDVWLKKKDLEKKDIPYTLFDSVFMKLEDQRQIRAVEADALMADIPQILDNTLSGHVYSHPDRDGKLRWEFLYLKYAEEYFPSLALQTARVSLGLKSDEMALVGSRGVRLGSGLFIPADRKGRMLINYYGREGTFIPVSAADVLSGKVQQKELENRIVFLGTSAIATYDLKNTPFSANMPGVEKNATIVENILTRNFLEKSPGYIEIIVLVMTGLVLGFFLPRLSAIRGAALSFALFSGYILGVQILFSFMNLWVNFIYPAANMMMIAVVVTVTKYFFEERKAGEIRRMFSSYVSPKIVEQIINNPEKAKLGGERKTVTVLFSDIIGFTTLSEQTSPEQVIELLNEYFEEMASIIFKWDGTLDKFVGDEIMAFWGAPVDQENHAESALRCALHMVASLEKLHEKWTREGKPVLDCGIGINTGEVVIGNIGAPGKKMDYTIIGDHVNLGARVEKLTRSYNAKIIITEFTLEHIQPFMGENLFGHIELNELDRVRVKGKEKEVRIFELKNMKLEQLKQHAHIHREPGD